MYITLNISVYSMALQIPNVLIAFELFGDAVDKDFREKVYCELYSQYKYIASHQEKHLLANHYFEDCITSGKAPASQSLF